MKTLRLNVNIVTDDRTRLDLGNVELCRLLVDEIGYRLMEWSKGPIPIVLVNVMPPSLTDRKDPK